MALLIEHVRGNEIVFTATPLDSDGAAVEPDYVELQLSFLLPDGTRDHETKSMSVQSDGTFRYVWDSSIAGKGRVHWCVRSIDPPTAQEGTFQLTANLANAAPSTP